jgi:hypothetical protein
LQLILGVRRTYLGGEVAETRLPGEPRGRAAVGQAYQKELADLDTLLRLGLEIVSTGTLTIGNKRGLDDVVIKVVLALYVKACKTTRAIRLVAASGLPEDALVLTRSLFETCVAILFILHKTPRRRAQMYLAHIPVRTKKVLEAWRRTPGLKRQVTKALLSAADEGLRDAEQRLGKKVVDRLRSGYSGMNIEQTAAQLGIAKTYQVFYRHASSFSHVSDVSEHMTFESDGTPILKVAAGPARTIRQSLVMAHRIFWTTLNRVDARFGLGHEGEVAKLRR